MVHLPHHFPKQAQLTVTILNFDINIKKKRLIFVSLINYSKILLPQCQTLDHAQMNVKFELL